MKEKPINKKVSFLKAFTVLICCTFFLAACNNKEGGGSEDDSFFGNMFKNSSEELKISSQDVSSRLDEAQGEQLLNGSEVADFYSNRNNEPIWTEESRRNNFYQELEQAEAEGLDFGDYHGNRLEELMADPTSMSKEDQALLELLLTDAFLEYGEDLFYGKLNPKELYTIWDVPRESKSISEVLGNGIDEGDIEKALTDLKPPHQIYYDLKKSLQEYDELRQEEGSITKIEEGELIEPGDTDERISALTRRLKELEVLDPDYSPEGNTYDERLQEAVEEFQKQKGLQIDALLGNSTIRQLNMGPGDRYNQILANLERWRWYPRDLGEHYILINIPAFELAVVRDGDTVRTHDIIAGTKERPTPIFSDSLQYIVLNPEWTIPHTIKNEDIIPSASRNPDYLRNNNISVISPEGESLNPSNINWNNDEVDNYTYVQKAGPSNPLGRVKIIYPNDYAIYLHDTPAKSLFEQNERAESSGCVRVQGALDLAAYVVREQENWDLDRINDVVRTGRTTQVPIKSPIRVHHFYWTTWRDNGNIVFTEDVYEQDREIYTVLQEN